MISSKGTFMPLITPPVKNIREVLEPLKEQILNRVTVTVKDELVGILPHKWMEPVTIPLVY